jgi:Protein of unknown function (DUF3140)
MVREQRVEPEVEQLWEDFHSCVNVTSEQLRAWLMTRGSGEEAFGPDPDLGLPQPGRNILAVLRRRKVDLTAEDIMVMRETVAEVRGLLDERPAQGLSDADWRHALLDLSPTASVAACRSIRRRSSRATRALYSAMSAGVGTAGTRRRKASMSREAAAWAAAARRTFSQSSPGGCRSVMPLPYPARAGSHPASAVLLLWAAVDILDVRRAPGHRVAHPVDHPSAGY